MQRLRRTGNLPLAPGEARAALASFQRLEIAALESATLYDAAFDFYLRS